MQNIDEPLREGFKQAGVKFLDTEIFREDVDRHLEKYYRMKITKAGDTWKVWVVVTDNMERDATFEDFSSVPRACLKNTAKRIVPFLEAYSKVLAEKLIEYQEVSQKTEKMAQAIL